MPAANIDDAIEMAASCIADISYVNPVVSLATQMGLWNEALFGAAGLFPPSQTADGEATANVRIVSDWFSASRRAAQAIEGPGPLDSGLVGTSACILAVVKALAAVRTGNANSRISDTVRDATVTAFNTIWCPGT